MVPIGWNEAKGSAEMALAKKRVGEKVKENKEKEKRKNKKKKEMMAPMDFRKAEGEDGR